MYNAPSLLILCSRCDMLDYVSWHRCRSSISAFAPFPSLCVCVALTALVVARVPSSLVFHG